MHVARGPPEREQKAGEQALEQEKARPQVSSEQIYRQQVDAIKARAKIAQDSAEQAQKEAREAAALAQSAAQKARAGASGHYAGYIGKTGDQYEGEITGNTRNGYGVMTLSNGGRLAGRWKNGQLDGPGILVFAPATLTKEPGRTAHEKGRGVQHFTQFAWNLFSGEWKDDRENGYAFAYFRRGGLYFGQVKTDAHMPPKFDGEGAMIDANGSIRAGVWSSNSLVEPIASPDPR